jgi:hypothetical protein
LKKSASENIEKSIKLPKFVIKRSRNQNIVDTALFLLASFSGLDGQPMHMLNKQAIFRPACRPDPALLLQGRFGKTHRPASSAKQMRD